jgi:hypothetical protein
LVLSVSPTIKVSEAVLKIHSIFVVVAVTSGPSNRHRQENAGEEALINESPHQTLFPLLPAQRTQGNALGEALYLLRETCNQIGTIDMSAHVAAKGPPTFTVKPPWRPKARYLAISTETQKIFRDDKTVTAFNNQENL